MRWASSAPLPLPACGERVGVRGSGKLQRRRMWPPLTLPSPHEGWGEGTLPQSRPVCRLPRIRKRAAGWAGALHEQRERPYRDPGGGRRGGRAVGSRHLSRPADGDGGVGAGPRRRHGAGASHRCPATAARPAPASAGDRRPRDPASLARQLQSELRRVGCYDGELSGVWTPRTRVAMKAFTDRVNASLPVDKPDQILLALVQRPPRRCLRPPAGPGQGPRQAGAARGRCGAEARPRPRHRAADRRRRTQDLRRRPSAAPAAPQPSRGPRRSDPAPPQAQAPASPAAPGERPPRSRAPRRTGAGGRRLRAPSAPHRPPLSAGQLCACVDQKPEAGRDDAVAAPLRRCEPRSARA